MLASPGGDLPFTLDLIRADGVLRAVARNADERVEFTTVREDGRQLLLRIDHLDSEIVAELSTDNTSMQGEWHRQAGKRVSRLPFSARRTDTRRFVQEALRPAEPGGVTAVPSVSGNWVVTFSDEHGEEPARGEFQQSGTRVTGTFLTPTGDHRFLEGEYRDGLLRLSAFDGNHAYLFHARARADGTLDGDFWSRDVYHARLTARRPIAEQPDGMPDELTMVGVRNPDRRISFTFPDLEGRMVSLSDGRFTGKVVLVNLFGSWCTNCHDEAPLLVEWHRRHRERGFEIVGLAFEMTGERERDLEYVRRFAARHRIAYPLLLAGTDDKSDASALLPDLTRVAAFPTTIFIGRDGRVRWIHTGFAGPGTGEHHRRLRERLEAMVEELVAEPSAKSPIPPRHQGSRE